MPRVFRRVGVTALAVTLLAGVAASGVATADNSAVAAGRDRPELQEAIQAAVDEGLTGVQLRVHDQRGEWVGSAGVRKLGGAAKPPTNGRFWVGSVTKTFTATLVLQLVAEGAVGLDGPVADYLPEFGLDRRITVRMLLQHTSGVFNYTGDFDPDGAYVPGIPAQGREWLANRFHTYMPAELVRLALAKPARFVPGTGWSYSNTNYTLAQLLIEKVTRHSYADEMKRRILWPLGLWGTEVPGARPEIRGPHAHGYYRYEEVGQSKTVDVSRQNLSLLPGAGDMISTTQDLRTFFSALNSGTLVPATLLAEMRTPHPNSGDYRYGLGVFVQDLSCGVTILHHNGGPPAGYGALMYSTPDGSTTLTASVNTVDDAVRTPGRAFQKLTQRLTEDVFCGGRATG